MVGLKNLEAELAITLYKINSQTFPRKFSEIFQDSYFEKKEQQNKTTRNTIYELHSFFISVKPVSI